MSLASAESPARLFERASDRSGVAFLDGRAAIARSPLSHVAWEPVSELRVDDTGRASLGGSPVDGDPLAVTDAFLATESRARRTVIGAVAYDLRHWIEPRSGPPRPSGLPLIALASYERCHTYDHLRREWRSSPPVLAKRRLGGVRLSSPRPRVARGEYRRLFSRVRAALAAGDVYQANLSFPFEASLRGDPAALYEHLAAASPAPYGAYLDFGDFQILSGSPELFLEKRGERIATRPIKGTRRRGATRAEDARLVSELRCDEKERAEHVMIVDLERNDLGRLATTGSVVVEELATVETYPTLHHLESTVRARTRPGVRFSDCLRALFPGGSITGAPKIRAMQILDELEGEARGFYTGGILHHPPGGDFTMSICIRTATLQGGRVRYGVGGGVVFDSEPDAEYAECLLKARGLFLAAGMAPAA